MKLKELIGNFVINYLIKHHPSMIKINRFSLVCDACGWTDNESHEYDEQYVRSLIGYKCPKCGSVVITQEQADRMIDLNSRINHVNHDDNHADKNGVRIRINSNDIKKSKKTN